ncbi:MAG TPA: helix-turn-helix transcriptional regulator [Lacunisphaera sp.]|nr:helix-turn-helix transcriptional regulator [Lacunisphaera sp.]
MLSLTTESDLLVKVPQSLREARQSLGWRQVDVADRSGVPVSTLRRFERTGIIGFPALAKIVVTLGLADRLLESLRPRTQEGPVDLEAFALSPRPRQRVRTRRT